MDKRSSLLSLIVCDEGKSFITFPPVVLSKENFFFILMFCQHWQHCSVVAAVDVVVVVAVEETVAAVIDQLYG
jgi:hypothetical protein